MKTNFKLLVLAVTLLMGNAVNAQNEIKTVFGPSKSVGGYGAISNKFTYLGDSYANLIEAYGGVFINKRFMIGFGGAATTNFIPVPLQYSLNPMRNMSYQYSQAGLVTEYVMGSDKAFHLAFSLFAGSGFTMQYERPTWNHDTYDYDSYEYYGGGEDFFFVAEPGVQLEINVFKWMRFSPGVSYRAAFGSSAVGLTDTDLSKMSYNATFKFGKF
jgi:hypothetical protein